MKFTELEQTQIEKLFQEEKLVKDIENIECRDIICYYLEDKFENEEEKRDFLYKSIRICRNIWFIRRNESFFEKWKV